MYRYKNKTDQELFLPNIGVVAPHEMIDSPVVIESQHLEELPEEEKAEEEEEK